MRLMAPHLIPAASALSILSIAIGVGIFTWPESTVWTVQIQTYTNVAVEVLANERVCLGSQQRCIGLSIMTYSNALTFEKLVCIFNDFRKSFGYQQGFTAMPSNHKTFGTNCQGISICKLKTASYFRIWHLCADRVVFSSVAVFACKITFQRNFKCDIEITNISHSDEPYNWLVQRSGMTFIAMVTPFCTCFAHIKASIKLSINAFILYHIDIEFKITPTLFWLFGFRRYYFLRRYFTFAYPSCPFSLTWANPSEMSNT